MAEAFQKVAAHALIKNGDKILVTRRSLVDDWKPGEWDLPGGSVEIGEEPIEALEREILEEVNLKTKVKGPIYVFSVMTSEVRHQFQIIYECDYQGGEIKLNPEDHDEYRWVTIDEMTPLPKIAFLESFLRFHNRNIVDRS